MTKVEPLSVVEFEGKKPKLHPSVFLAPGSWVIGDVTLDEDVNVWTNAVIRGDDDTVRVGARTTVLEGGLIEAPTGYPVEVGSDVIISHGATVHGARVEDGSIIGIGAIVLDGSRIGSRCIVGSGALVSPRTEVPPNQLVLGFPAKPVRECKDAEHEYMRREHERTLSKAKVYKKLYAAKK